MQKRELRSLIHTAGVRNVPAKLDAPLLVEVSPKRMYHPTVVFMTIWTEDVCRLAATKFRFQSGPVGFLRACKTSVEARR